MPPVTVLDLLTNALVGIRVHRMAAPLPPEMADHALRALNRLLETWTVDRRLVFRVQELTVPLTTAQTYTIGPGGQVNTARPVGIQAGFTRIGSNDYPYAVWTRTQYSGVFFKPEGSMAPEGIYYEPALPLGILHVWPVSTGVLHLFVDQPLGPLILNDVLSVPPGYDDAMTMALGKRVAPDYGQTLDPVYVENWRQAETALRRRNHEPVYAVVSIPGAQGHPDDTWIETGGT